MTEPHRIALVLLASTLPLGPPGVALGGVGTSCTFDDTTATLDVVVVGAVILGRFGEAIAVDGNACGIATRTNVDTIQIDATNAEAVTIDLGGGALEPGSTDEGDGTSEIEILIEGGVDINIGIEGSAENDRFGLARAFDGEVWDVIDLDAAGAGRDADVWIHGDDAGLISISGGDGDDRVDATGAAYGVPFPGASTIAGGPGDDEISYLGALESADPTFVGGPGRDELNVSGLAADERASVDLGLGVATIGATSVESVTGIEVVLGHRGLDVLVGAAGNQTLTGGGGNDTMQGRAGNDHLRGGPGRDDLQGGSDRDTCRGGPGTDTLTSCER